MTWATPTLAIIAAAIAIPSLVILYFLKLRRRSVEISTTLTIVVTSSATII